LNTVSFTFFPSFGPAALCVLAAAAAPAGFYGFQSSNKKRKIFEKHVPNSRHFFNFL
jgi:hypothetical protein